MTHVKLNTAQSHVPRTKHHNNTVHGKDCFHLCVSVCFATVSSQLKQSKSSAIHPPGWEFNMGAGATVPKSSDPCVHFCHPR